jgi:hypothetical protein
MTNTPVFSYAMILKKGGYSHGTGFNFSKNGLFGIFLQ